MKQQITENDENIFFGKKCPGVSSDLKSILYIDLNVYGDDALIS